jgi:hypothetical protein
MRLPVHAKRLDIYPFCFVKGVVIVDAAGPGGSSRIH